MVEEWTGRTPNKADTPSSLSTAVTSLAEIVWGDGVLNFRTNAQSPFIVLKNDGSENIVIEDVVV